MKLLVKTNFINQEISKYPITKAVIVATQVSQAEKAPINPEPGISIWNMSTHSCNSRTKKEFLLNGYANQTYPRVDPSIVHNFYNRKKTIS